MNCVDGSSNIVKDSTTFNHSFVCIEKESVGTVSNMHLADNTGSDGRWGHTL